MRVTNRKDNRLFVDIETPALPVLFRIIPFVIGAIWILVAGLGCWFLFELFTGGIQPEDFGRLVGRIVSGFRETAQ